MRFFAGETSRALAPSLAVAAENRKNLPLALRLWTRQHSQTDLQGSGKKNFSAVFFIMQSCFFAAALSPDRDLLKL